MLFLPIFPILIPLRIVGLNLNSIGAPFDNFWAFMRNFRPLAEVPV